MVVVFVLLLARRAKREGDRGFIHNFMMMVMMRFQEGTSTTTRTRGYVGERVVSLHGV